MNLIDLISKHPVPVTRFQRPYVIAEAGVNHEGSMDIARRLIDEAALGGADAIKFQTYKAGTLASKHSPAYWDTSKEPTPSQYELFKKHDSFWKGEFENLKKHCDQAWHRLHVHPVRRGVRQIPQRHDGCVQNLLFGPHEPPLH